MGVPKFFRYISERYPCLSELVKEYQIPGFDNLYLDMNGIIHTCSHPDDSDAAFRITEKQILVDIFQYIEILFRLIKPQKLFFMAIDGVAPRAKMNQQRGRRFRSAKEALKQEETAKQRNIAMPETARFDSNCITPGTIFMAKLHEQLKYFVSNKVTTDKSWQKCTIILSGHETPGEGEHKIMDYIRYSRSQPGYDPNTRHCLYGLDADLIMLGLCSHEPHFSLLREEVKFGKKSLRKTSPENTTFYLLHLSLMREYLREEFISVANKISFDYNIENIIDDWVLLGFLVGNDFVPHLPHLHINSDALPLLYKTYMTVLPQLDGYLNENGILIIRRFQIFMKALTAIDYSKFEETYDDLQYFKSKTGRDFQTGIRKSYKPRQLETWNKDELDEDFLVCLEPDTNSFNKDLEALIQETSDFAVDDSEESSITALNKIFLLDQEVEGEKDMQIEVEFQLHKKNYYESKMHLMNLTADTLQQLSYEYIRALQWILHYYYNGVCSWSWFYPYHYAPYISDIKDFLQIDLHFDLGKPFLPYEQLLAVLPPASKESLPKCFHELMTDPTSVIKDFYPDNFDTDLNGKKQEWEAVVLIPFIEENRLIQAMVLPLAQLTAEERERNAHGTMLVYRYSNGTDLGTYCAPAYFPDIDVNRALCTPLTREAIHVPRGKLVKGICKGAAQGVYYPGFPTTKHLKYTSKLMKKKVRVFDQPSRDNNMILSIDPPLTSGADAPEICDIVADYLGKTVFVRWPHLIEATVVAISNAAYRYDISADGKGYNVIENQGNIQDNFQVENYNIETYFMERRGIDVGATTFLVHVRELVGRRCGFLNEGKIRVNLAKEYAAVISTYPLQTIVRNIAAYDDNLSDYQQLGDLFADGTTCFMLGHPHYGTTGKVIHCQESFDKGRVKVCMQVAEDPDFTHLCEQNDSILNEYYSLHSAAARISMHYTTFARVTGTVLIGRGASKNVPFDEAAKVNIGLNLKNNRKFLGVRGYVKSIDSKWYFSKQCLDLVDSYRNEFFSVFRYLNTPSNNELPFEIELFPEDKGDGTTLKKIQEWLNKQPHNSIEMQSCHSQVLETAVVSTLEEMMGLYKQIVRPKQIKMTVRPHLIHIPGLITGNVSADNSTTYELFDRVVNIRECYTVPVGFTGTVIGIHKVPNDWITDGNKSDVLLDVLYDLPFAGGTSLNGSSSNRGYKMSPNDLINKSHGDRKLIIQLEKKTPNYKVYKPAQPQNSESSAFVSWNKRNYASNYKSRNRDQSQPVHFQNIPPPMQKELPMFANVSLKPDYLQYNSNNIPIHVPPPEPTKNLNQSSPTKSVNPSKSPKRMVEKQEEDPVEEQKSSDVTVQVKVERQPRSNQPGTEMLRNLLRMNEQENKKIEQNLPKPNMPNTVDNFFQMAKSSRSINKDNPNQDRQPSTTVTGIQSTSKPSNDFPSAKLMTFFVSHGMGCPVYTYSQLQGGFKAEVKIPTNLGTNVVVISSLCRTRDDATEDVAANTLLQLKIIDLSMFVPKVPSFPNPPRQWCTDKELNNNRSHQMESVPKRAESNWRTDSSSSSSNRSTLNPASVPFVPLQVTLKQYEKTVSAAHVGSTSKNNKGNRNKMQPKSQVNSLPQQNIEPNPNLQLLNSSSTQQRPKAVRQMRIAANFRNMPS